MDKNNLDMVTAALVKKHQERTGQAPAQDTPDQPPVDQAASDPEPAEIESIREEELPTESVESEDTDLEDVILQADEDEDADDRGVDADEEPEEVRYHDTDLIEVMVDGEAKEVTLRDLKNAFGGEGAIDKRLYEATEERKAAIAEREAVAKESETAREAMLAIVQQLDSMLHQPTVPMPDDALKTSNPKAYIAQRDRYEHEARMLEQSRAKLVEAFQQHAKHTDEVRAKQRAEQLHLLNRNLEPLRNEKTRKQAAEEILQAVDVYGFSPEDLKGVVDHRIYMMAYDAMQYRKLTSKGKDETQLGQLKEKAERKARRLRSASAGTRKNKLSRSQREARALREKAQKSGKPEDVAALMAYNRRNRR